jgi:predicted RND superfamily exporter protein
MDGFFRTIIEKRRGIVVIFLFISIISIFLAKEVEVNNNLVDYLPSSAPSTIAIDVMEEAFITEDTVSQESGEIIRKKANSYVLVENITIDEGLEIKKALLSIEGVLSVKWLDDIKKNYPIEMMDSEDIEKYYKDNIGIFTVSTYKDEAKTIMAEVEKYIDKPVEIYGSGAGVASANSELLTAMMFILPICLFVVILTSLSYVEPILFLLTIGIAILINNGTNILFGEISFVTNSAASILQLAVSMDYSIFLLHMFAEFREKGLEPKEAMIQALRKSFTSITASAATTIIGFAALILMTFTIGKDMGVVMAKGIVISIISVFTLLPTLTILSYKWIDKTKHKPFMPSFKSIGEKILNLRLPIDIIAIVVILLSYLAVQNNTFFYGMNDNELSTREEVFGKNNELILLIPSGDIVKEKQLSEEIKGIAEVSDVTSYVDTVGAVVPTEFLEVEDVSQLISNGYSRMIINANMQEEGSETFSVINKIRDISQAYYGNDYYLAGSSVSTLDIKEVVTSDMIVVNSMAIIGIFIILLITFKSITIPIILVLVIESSIWINLGIPYFSEKPVFFIVYLIISSIQLGATVDYAILFTSHYVKERRSLNKVQAINQTFQKTIITILTSATLLTAGGGVLSIVTSDIVLKQMGLFVGRGGVLSAILVIFLLPALLYVFDNIIQKTSFKLNFYN